MQSLARRSVFAVSVVVALVAVGCVEPAEQPPPRPALSAFFGGDVVVRISPDRSHVAIGAPPVVVDTTSLLVDVEPGAWAAGWSELYLVAGEALLWRADDDVTGITNLGAATAVEQNADTGIVITSSGADIYDKHSGVRVVHVDGATSGSAADPVVSVHTETTSAAWTGTMLLRSSTVAEARSNKSWVQFDKLYRRDTGVAVEVTGSVSLVTDDDRYIEHDFQHVAVADASGTLVEKCRVPDRFVYNMVGFGDFYACFNDVFDIDGNRLITMKNGSQLLFGFRSPPPGLAFFVEEREGSDVFTSRFSIMFKNGRLITRESDGADVFYVGVGGDMAATYDVVGQTARLLVLTDSGTVLAYKQRHGPSEFAMRDAGGVLISGDSTGLSLLDYGNTKLELEFPLTGLARDATVADGRLVLLDVDGALSSHALFFSEDVLIDAGPFDTVAVHGQLILATVTSGDRTGLYTFAMPTR